jgi:hypothetical protein
MARKKTLEEHFKEQWSNPPAPFNPCFDPKWKEKARKIADIVDRGEPYATRKDRKLARERAYVEVEAQYAHKDEAMGAPDAC